jgi:hypothetical protein
LPSTAARFTEVPTIESFISQKRTHVRAFAWALAGTSSDAPYLLGRKGHEVGFTGRVPAPAGKLGKPVH